MVTNDEVLTALREVLDPEIGLNVVDLGLIRTADVAGSDVRIGMLLTSPTCPLGSYLAAMAEDAIRRRLPDAGAVTVTLLPDQKWSPEMMSASAKRDLGWAP